MFAIGNDELSQMPPLNPGEAVLCPNCGSDHIVEAGKDAKTGEENTTLLFYKCGTTAYLAGIDGTNIMSRFIGGAA